jgi:Ethylbenzene dehydrogenase
MKTKNLIMGLLIISVIFTSCTNDNQVLDPLDPDPPGQEISDKELVAISVTTGPAIDGVVDAGWNDAPMLRTTVTVPDPGNQVFRGYEGNTNDVTLRALYDNEYIYFLAEWADNNQSLNRQTWYFDPVTSLWEQEDRNPTFNDDGVMIRQPFYEDKFAMLWNVNNSVANWDVNTCFASCHTDLSEEDGYARHYTQLGETIDMWHWKSVRTDVNIQADDQYQNDDFPNGRHGDDKIGGGYTNNKQDLVMTGTSETVTVPKYFIPGLSYYYWITQDEIDAGTAKLITAVDIDGILTYDGGSIDPNVEIGFQREGSTTGEFGIPSIYTTEFIGSRGDIIAKGVYTGSGWVLEMKRKLTTADTEAQDVDFAALEDLAFGIGVFDNAGLAHGIKAGLLLKFEE